ncbi:MAG: anti-sigma factor [Planctomycetota bacterium]
MSTSDADHGGDDSADLMELVVGDLLDDLTGDEREALGKASRDVTPAERWQLETTAAAVHVHLSAAEFESMPSHLFDAIRRQATRSDAQESGKEQREISDAPIDRANPMDRGESALSSSTVPRRELLAWACLAASLMVIASLWVSGRPAEPSTSLASLRSNLIAQADDLIQVDWSPGTTALPEAVTGDVVWSTQRQEGYLRFDGLPVNDPAVRQYQLWIIDPKRDDEPIDGGVFDVGSDGEVVVKIDAKLRVLSPQVFAVTIEKPGGVVVSDQSNLPLIAAVK